MIPNKIRNEKHIHRIILTLFFIFLFASTFVYAQNTEKSVDNPAHSSNLTAANLDTPCDTAKQVFDTTSQFSDSTFRTSSGVAVLLADSELNPSAITLESDITTEGNTVASDECLTTKSIPVIQTLSMSAIAADSLYQENNYDSFFEHSVFVGDSLTVGFETYCNSHSDSIASDSTYFLAKEGGSAFAAVSSKALTTHAKVMPKYQGTLQLIEDSIAQINDIKKVFICFGMNDLTSSTPEKFLNNFTTLINRILEKSPEVDIYVLSIPCIVTDVQSGELSNSSIQAANMLLETTCQEKNWGFINTTEYLMNNNLAICDEYSSDGFIHENTSAYRIWTKVLRNYAYESMNHNTVANI